MSNITISTIIIILGLILSVVLLILQKQILYKALFKRVLFNKSRAKYDILFLLYFLVLFLILWRINLPHFLDIFLNLKLNGFERGVYTANFIAFFVIFYYLVTNLKLYARLSLWQSISICLSILFKNFKTKFKSEVNNKSNLDEFFVFKSYILNWIKNNDPRSKTELMESINSKLLLDYMSRYFFTKKGSKYVISPAGISQVHSWKEDSYYKKQSDINQLMLFISIVVLIITIGAFIFSLDMLNKKELVVHYDGDLSEISNIDLNYNYLIINSSDINLIDSNQTNTINKLNNFSNYPRSIGLFMLLLLIIFFLLYTNYSSNDE